MTAATVPVTSGPLSGRQELFCRNYVLGTSAAAAARQAGYSEESARTQAWRLLRMPAVQERIATLQVSAQAAQRALCAQLWEKAEKIHDRALRASEYATALRALALQLRLYQSLGLPAEPADTDDLLREEEEGQEETAEGEGSKVGSVVVPSPRREEGHVEGVNPTSPWSLSAAAKRGPASTSPQPGRHDADEDRRAYRPFSPAPAGGEGQDEGADEGVAPHVAEVLRGDSLTELNRAVTRRWPTSVPPGQGMRARVDGC